MKKTLIAMAAIAAVTSVSAQSSVTLYGRLDASLANLTTKVNGVKQYAGATKTGIESSNLNTQFWGLRGTEDLGGGLKAEFKLESNFNIDTGAASATFFDREAWVGVSGGFGTVKLGRNYTAYDNLAGAVNHTMNSNINVTSAVNATGLKTYDTRVSNSVHYTTPKFGNVSAAVSYGFGEDKTATLSASNDMALHLLYATGPVVAGIAYSKESNQAPALDIKHTLIGGSYNFGVAQLTGSFQQSKSGATKDKEYQIGVRVPVGAFTFAAGYADSESKTGVTKLKGDGFALVAIYDLSKRTSVYAGYESTKVDTTALTETKVTNMAFGVRHTF